MAPSLDEMMDGHSIKNKHVIKSSILLIRQLAAKAKVVASIDSTKIHGIFRPFSMLLLPKFIEIHITLKKHIKQSKAFLLIS